MPLGICSGDSLFPDDSDLLVLILFTETGQEKYITRCSNLNTPSFISQT